MYYMIIYALLLTQSLCAIDNWEHVTPEQVSTDNQNLFHNIQQKIITGVELRSISAEQIEALTVHQLNELGKHLTLHRKAIRFMREHQGQATFWSHLISMRAELVAHYTHQKNAPQLSHPSKYDQRRADIDSLNLLLLQQLEVRGNIPHDPDATHLLDPDSMYYVQRRLIGEADSAGNIQDNQKLCSIIHAMTAAGAPLSRIGYRLGQLSLQELDTIKDQLAIYREAHHAAGNLCGDGIFWNSVWHMHHRLEHVPHRPHDPAYAAYIAQRLKQCNILTSLVKKRITQHNEPR